tara:strand:+ start:10124 stop:10240 length:117 start_codon:yes stop_codon:yes gene_type:complete
MLRYRLYDLQYGFTPTLIRAVRRTLRRTESCRDCPAAA